MQSIASKDTLKTLAKAKYDDISKICIYIIELLINREHMVVKKYSVIKKIEANNFEFGFFLDKKTGKVLPMIEIPNKLGKKYFSVEKDKIIQLFDDGNFYIVRYKNQSKNNFIQSLNIDQKQVVK